MKRAPYKIILTAELTLTFVTLCIVVGTQLKPDNIYSNTLYLYQIIYFPSEDYNIDSWSYFILSGDDCVSIQTGCSNVHVHHINCGPGHGIR